MGLWKVGYKVQLCTAMRKRYCGSRCARGHTSGKSKLTQISARLVFSAPRHFQQPRLPTRSLCMTGPAADPPAGRRQLGRFAHGLMTSPRLQGLLRSSAAQRTALCAAPKSQLKSAVLAITQVEPAPDRSGLLLTACFQRLESAYSSQASGRARKADKETTGVRPSFAFFSCSARFPGLPLL
jgi:hypothetical protein